MARREARTYGEPHGKRDCLPGTTVARNAMRFAAAMPASATQSYARIWLVWTFVGLLLVLEFFINFRWGPGRIGDTLAYPFVSQLTRAWLWALATPGVFALSRRWPLSGVNWVRHAFAAAGLMVVINIVRVVLIFLVMAPRAEWGGVLWYALADWWGPRSLMDFAIYWGIIAVARHLAIRDERMRAAADAQHLRAQLAETELTALKQQLQPHFLFNSLNAVAGLMRANRRDQAVETVAQLAGLMRSLMANSGVLLISFARELEYLERYLAVERVRLDDRLCVRLDIEAECLRAQVPTLLLQPLVENAIKHGIARRETPGNLVVSAHKHNGRLCIRVINDLADQAHMEPRPAGNGLGHRSVRARLEKHYGADHRFTFSVQPACAVAELELPYQCNPKDNEQS